MANLNKAKRNYLMGFCSLNVVNAVLNGPLLYSTKSKALDMAWEKVKKDGRARVHMGDYEEALKEIQEGEKE